jgi:hypothetical protein
VPDGFLGTTSSAGLLYDSLRVGSPQKRPDPG